MRHGYRPGMHHMNGYGDYGFIWVLVIGIILLIMLFLMYKLLQQNKQSNRDTGIETTNTALNILKERYVKGEITEEEFIRMKKVLEDK